jgi:hypothetical protein
VYFLKSSISKAACWLILYNDLIRNYIGNSELYIILAALLFLEIMR